MSVTMLANIAFVAIMVVPCIGLYFLRRAHHRRQHAAELRAPLLPKYDDFNIISSYYSVWRYVR